MEGANDTGLKPNAKTGAERDAARKEREVNHSMWSPPAMCECGHRYHFNRCGPAQTGCPCSEYTEAEEKTSPGFDAPYYQRVDDGC